MVEGLIRILAMSAGSPASAGRSIAANLAIVALAVTIGLAIGAIQFRRLKLVISGVPFFFAALRSAGLHDRPPCPGVLAGLCADRVYVCDRPAGGAGIRGVASGRRRSTERPRVFRHRIGPHGAAMKLGSL